MEHVARLQAGPEGEGVIEVFATGGPEVGTRGSGRSHRHVGAMADHLLRTLKDEGYGKVRVEGLPHCDWVLIDTGDVIIHLFRPEVRSFYNIEKIWSVEPPRRAAAH